jgi:vacuolar iron transporter family protein
MAPQSGKIVDKAYRPFTDIVIGISDGIIIPFAVTTGFSVIALSNESVIKAGITVTAAGAFIMGLAGYFAARDRQQQLSEKTSEEEQQIKKEELEKTIQLFKQLNLGEDMQQQAAEEIEKDSKAWREYLQEHLPKLEISGSSRLPLTAAIISLSYITGGLIPLLPYLFFKDKEQAFLYSAVLSVAALIIFGCIKSQVNKEPLMRGTIRILILGLLAALAAFAVAKTFAA